MMEYHNDTRLLFSKYKKNTRILLPPASKEEGRMTEKATKSVYFDSEDGYIKKILTNHGWKVVNDEKNCTLKWVYHLKHNTYSELSKKTKINHFPNSHMLTTKLGLCKTLNGQRGVMTSTEGKSHLQYYPRSYDLSQQNDTFVKDFRKTAVLNLLKKIMISIEIHDQKLFEDIHLKSTLYRRHNTGETNWIKQLQNLYKTQGLYSHFQPKTNHYTINSKIFQGLLWYFSLAFSLDCPANEDNFNDQHMNLLVQYSQYDPPYTSFRDHFGGDPKLTRTPTQNALIFFFRIYEEARSQIKWFRVDGLRNIWVVKANDSSRGRNIVLVSSLQQLKLLNSGTKLVQKYIEDVWIYRSLSDAQFQRYPFLSKLDNKKFDIRLWVLVRSFSPLQIYIYHQGYLRISKQSYQLQDIRSNSTHLTNFTVNWKARLSQSESSYVLLSEFTEYLEKEGLRKRDKLMGEIHEVVVKTMQTADLTVSSCDGRCFQLFGFDVILDSELKPWLLEVNMSPACKERGRLAQQLERMGSGLLSLVGLIGPSTYQSGWLPLTISSNKKSLKKQNTDPLSLTRSQGKLRPILTKLNSFNIEDTDLSRSNSILPLISQGRSTYQQKNQNVLIDNSDLVLIGRGLVKKQFEGLDREIRQIEAVRIIQKFYGRMKKLRMGEQRKEKQHPLTFLRMFECLVALTHKNKLRVFKKLKKKPSKKPLKRQYSKY